MLELGEKAFVIAEAGTNHASWAAFRLGRALRYVRLAAAAGADAVKFQIFADPIDDMFCWLEGDARRSHRWLDSCLDLAQWREVKKVADSLGIMLLASVFQDKTVGWLEDLGLEATKVASRAAKTFPYGRGPRPYLVSGGMWPVPVRDDVIELQCEANYPSAQWWNQKVVGFSDHSGTPERAIAAIRSGCKLVEVHFYDHPQDAGPDRLACLTLNELEQVCHEF